MLRTLSLRGVGPAASLEVQLKPRLNVVTGDNGLGKSFLLDAAWWALTRSWAGAPALAQPNSGEASIGYAVDGKSTIVENTVPYDVERQGWFHRQGRPPIPGFIVFARADGGFAVMDPARNDPPEDDDPKSLPRRRPTAFLFSQDELWNGLYTDGVPLCNGLLRDWRTWQSEHSTEFTALTKALATLSPERGEQMIPGTPTRVGLLDARSVPTLRLPYGDVPITHASAGFKRIIGLAYALVWAWHEHRAASMLLGTNPSTNVTVIIDEVEAHLHPRWQRVIVPAVLDALNELGAPTDSQVIAATHSPLVLASLEDRWDTCSDELFTLDLNVRDDGADVELRKVDWLTHGDANSWLTSEIFDLEEPTSVGAETALREARAMLAGNPTADDVRAVAQSLVRHLPETDPIFARLGQMVERAEANAA